MASPGKVEVIKQAIKQVMDEGGGSDDKHHLSILLSQLETLEGESEEPSYLAVSKSDSIIIGDLTKVSMSKLKEDEEKGEKEKIVKELKEIKKQNLVTHCLLSVMIVLTVAWQISEVSIILTLKDGISHPFRSIGSVFKSMIKPRKANGNTEDTESSLATCNLIESSPVHDLKLPELPHVELPKIDFGLNFED